MEVTKVIKPVPAGSSDTTINAIQRYADAIRVLLAEDNPNEMVTLHVSKNMEIMKVDTTKKVYASFREGWKEL